ncbi:CBS domain-containing protein [Salsipaludibacter albus]|uniref:CBS domain-containing protein n=1 Tax=Salsipaludibacter albus TaxID=2849650 RepID=UPI00236777A6|nr:CBS domain-containing protein [Salsipaludibacter albus]
MAITVSSILAAKGSDVATIGPDATLAEASARLAERNIGALVVSTGDQSVDGILSERDIVRRLDSHGEGCLGHAVRDVMTAPVTTCHGPDTADQLMARMTEERFRHLPVVDDAGLLAGIISIGDVVRSRIDELETQAQSLRDYVTGSSY